MADIASAVADSTRGPGRNLMVGSTYWVLLGAVGMGVGFLFVGIRAKHADIGRTEGGAFHNRLRLLRLPSWRVWKRGGTRDPAGRLVEGVKYPNNSSSIRFMVLAAKTRAHFTLASIAGFHVSPLLSISLVCWCLN